MPPSSKSRDQIRSQSYDGFAGNSTGIKASRAANKIDRLLTPRRERVVERPLPGRALFDRDDGAALVDVDQRHVEPGAFLQELQIAGAVGIDVGEADQEEAVGDLHGEPRKRCAARLL